MDPYPPPWSLVVADGSANVYACEHREGGRPRCEYRPITPAQSSTGRYSGGDPWTVELDPGQVQALWREVEAAMRDTAGHIEAREKTSVAVEADGAARGSWILNADAGAALMRTLTALRPASAAPAHLLTD